MTPNRTLADQLAPLAEQLRESQGLVRPISQVILTCDTADQPGAIDAIRRAVLKWIQSKAGRLPDAAWNGEPFELADVGAQRAECVAFDDYWAVRVDDADSSVARRTWVTEVALARAPNAILFGARLFSVTRGDDPPAMRSLPKFVREVAAVAEFRFDGQPLRHAPWVIDTPDRTEALARLVCDPTRRRPVCVFALPENSTDPRETTIAVEPLLRRLTGASHIAVLTGPASFHLTRLVGKEFSVFQGAIRTYRPGLDLDRSDPNDHPLALAHRINPAWFENRLIEEVLRSTIARPDLEDELPPYARVKQLAQERMRAGRKREGATDPELLDLADKEIKVLQSQFAEQNSTFSGLLAEAERERDAARAQFNEERARNIALMARVTHLEQRLEGMPAWQGEDLPTSLEQLETWSREQLAGKVVLLNRAVRAARRSEFEDVPLVYKALLYLRDFYVPMKRDGGSERLAACEAARQSLYLEDAPCFAGSGAGMEGDTYYVEFGGRRRQMDWHLKGSTSRDPRYGFRLYYLWDDETEQVVVGSLPNHLSNRVT